MPPGQEVPVSLGQECHNRTALGNVFAQFASSGIGGTSWTGARMDLGVVVVELYDARVLPTIPEIVSASEFLR
jgi:hypothetical protein